MARALRTVVLTFLLSLCFYGVASAQDGGASATPPSAGDLALVLAPLVAAATAIERIIEMIFGWYESVLMNAGSFLGLGGQYVKWAQEQIAHYQQAVVSFRTGSEAASGEGLSTLTQAEEKLAEAQERLLGWLESPFYTSRKKVIALILGIVLGVVLAFATRLRMLALLGLQPGTETGVAAIVPWMDMLLTGLIIGTGSAPVHSLIGLLQNTKDAVDEARGLWKGKAIAEVQGVLEDLRRETARPLEPERVIIPSRAAEEVPPDRGTVPAPTQETVLRAAPLTDVEVKRAARRLLR